MKLLLTHGSDIDARTDNGSTPLHLAAFADDPEIVGILLEGGADVYATDKEGRTPLDCAPTRAHTQIVELLQSAGGQYNKK